MKLKITLMCIVFLLLFTVRVESQIASSNLDKRVSLDLEGVTLVYVLATLAQDYDIPIGFEKSLSHSDNPQMSVHVRGMSLRDFLDLILAKEPAYMWTESDGVINIVPTQDRSRFIQKLLELQVATGSIDINGNKIELRNRILQLPEVCNLMEEERVQVGFWPDVAFSERLPTCKESESGADMMSFVSLLNKIVKGTKHRTWVIELHGHNRDLLYLAF